MNEIILYTLLAIPHTIFSHCTNLSSNSWCWTFTKWLKNEPSRSEVERILASFYNAASGFNFEGIYPLGQLEEEEGIYPFNIDAISNYALYTFLKN